MTQGANYDVNKRVISEITRKTLQQPRRGTILKLEGAYDEDDVAIIESSIRPAKALLDDLSYRDFALRDLLEGLEAIGNKRAASIVKKKLKSFLFQ